MVAARADRVLFMKDGNIAAELRFGIADETSIEHRVEKIIEEMKALEV
jgi:hypothetical protein